MTTVKAKLTVESGEVIPCMFNPSELAMSFQAGWSAEDTPATKGGGGGGGTNDGGVPRLKFTGTKNATFSLSLLLDTTDTGTKVTEHTAKLIALFDISESLKAKENANGYAKRPATVRFTWGEFESFEAVVTSLNLTYTYFAANGTPLRAKADLGMMQFDSGAWPRQNPTSGTPRPHRVHRVQPGETLDRISAQHYGDSTRWRALAVANGIEDPLRLRAGALLAVPDLSS